ncbi:hypothetical protein VLK81_02210 [Citroniella saccharovorans]|uniref:Uncharacterized protein n=1 Tax=Citroniella saccharovorans TaxID=2053367 RepID=A0AAW9MXS9_9FIRM|nr:hypothetical protein [Citroniella saccharovorans]MEB3428847.1 hypothetical protein [Citroniella saccharovorans]
MEKFEAGGVYRDDGVEIEVLKRTEKEISYRFTSPCYLEINTKRIFRRRIKNYYKGSECVFLDGYWSLPCIYADRRVNC